MNAAANQSPDGLSIVRDVDTHRLVGSAAALLFAPGQLLLVPLLEACQTD